MNGFILILFAIFKKERLTYICGRGKNLVEREIEDAKKVNQT